MTTLQNKLGLDLVRGLALACVVALLAAGAVLWITTENSGRKVTAYFSEGVGVYEGGEVRILGVPSGSIDSVTPEPKRVKVEMSVDQDVPVPANPHAVVVAPSVVSDRYIQLDRYTGGPQLTSGTVIPFSRTQTPAELDQVYKSLNEVADALGPNGANKQGALSRLLNTGAENLDGNGRALKQTVSKLGEAARTLNGKQGALFDTVRNLAKFSTALAQSDSDIREFNGRFADVSDFLADERQDLAAAVGQLGPALGKVKSFIDDNRGLLKSNVDNLSQVSQVLVRERSALSEVLDVAPLAVNNLGNAYNASSGTLDARPAINELSDPPIVLLCKQLRQGTPKPLPPTLADACDSLSPIVQGAAPLPPVSEILSALQEGRVPQLPKQGLGAIAGSLGGGGQ
jgi:phospholipid/cholesterol/gamma-HCH transport system substrate-binding protein